MSRRLAFAAATFALLVAMPSAMAEPSRRGAIEGAIEGAIKPGYAGLATSAGLTDAATRVLCADPSDASLSLTRTAFGQLVRDFSRVEFIRFGPMMEDNRIERFFFWPDKRGLGLRQVQTILANADETATTVDGVHAKSVAVQGLGALEYALYGTDAEALTGPDGAFRCRFAHAITGNLRAMAQATSDAWSSPDGFGRTLLEPDPRLSAYREIDDSLQEVLGALIHGLEALRDLRLKPALGKDAASANPNAFAFHRAGLSQASLAANFDGLRQLTSAMKLEEILPPDARSAPSSIETEFETAEKTLAAIEAPLPQALGDPAMRKRLDDLMLLAHDIQTLVADRIAGPLGISAGFSALDGD